MTRERTLVERSMPRARARRRRLAGVEKLATGIRGLDETLMGGLPRGRVTLLSGGPGSCKTVLGQEFLYRGITVHGQPGVCVTCDEPVEHITRNVAGFGWDYDALVRRGALAFIDAGSRALGFPVEVDEAYDLSPLLDRIRAAVERIGARRLVFDSLSPLFERLGSERAVRAFVEALCRTLEALDVTTLLLAEARTAGPGARAAETAQYVADGAVELSVELGQQRMLRRIVVRKLRGVGYHSAPVAFDVGPEGVEIFPKLALDEAARRKLGKTRVSTGVPGLDETIGGGLPEGHVVLLSGNTGTGKSAFGLHFVRAGLEAGEGAVYVALEEPAAQLLRAGAGHGPSLRRYERAGKLRIVEASLVDVFPDRLLHEIVHAVDVTGARRVVFDSLSSLESATMHPDQVREFLFQLTAFLKHRAITAFLTYLVPAAFGAEGGQLLGALATSDLRLSSVVDGIFLLRYVEREQRVMRLVNVLKLRTSAHSHDIFTFEIGRRGVRIGERFEL